MEGPTLAAVQLGRDLLHFHATSCDKLALGLLDDEAPQFLHPAAALVALHNDVCEVLALHGDARLLELMEHHKAHDTPYQFHLFLQYACLS